MDTPVATDTVGVEKPAAPASRGLVVKVAAVGVLAGFLGLLAWATLVPSGGSNLVARVAAGERPSAPAFDHQVAWRRLGAWPPGSSRLIDDGRLALEELRGRPAVLNFWASWCIPCRDEAPILNESARSHRGKVVFVGIDVRDLRADARAFLREFSVPYVSVRDRDDESFRAYGLSGVPETYFLDASGRIIGHTAGPVTAQTLEEGIAQVLATTVP